MCGAHFSPTPQFLVRGDPTVRKLEATVTIEALAFWFRSNAQLFLHDQLHGPTGSLYNFRRIPADGVAVRPRMFDYSRLVCEVFLACVSMLL